METDYGQKLAEAVPKYKHIYLVAVFRILFVLVIVLEGEGGFDGVISSFESGTWQVCVIGIAVAILVGLVTLRHKKDIMEFYEYGICFRGRWYSFEDLGQISWESLSNRHMFFFDALRMQTDIKSFNVTYVDHPKRAYNQAYMNSIKL